MPFRVPKYLEKNRVRHGIYRSDPEDGPNGKFLLISPQPELCMVASDGMGWEHVSVSLEDRCPTWEEMCRVKRLFWDKEDTVIQYHPPESDYVNWHPYVLHLWRPIDIELPRPLPIMVEPRSQQQKAAR